MENDIRLMRTPLVSVIIPVYNGQDYLADTIRSVLAQTWRAIEVIVVNDGSTDTSAQVANHFAADGVMVINQPNRGASAARNTGTRMAKGEYIQYLDADDLLHPRKIASQVTALSSPDQLALCATVYFNEDDDPAAEPVKHEWYREGSTDPADFLVKLYGGAEIGPTYGGMVAPHAWLTPAKLIAEAGDWNEQLSLTDDGEFFSRVVLAAKKIVYIADAAVYYRKYTRPVSLSRRRDDAAQHSAFTAVSLMSRQLLARSDTRESRLAAARLFAELAFTLFLLNPRLARQAEQEVRKLAPHWTYRPYIHGMKSIVSHIIGWKSVRRLEGLKQRLIDTK